MINNEYLNFLKENIDSTDINMFDINELKRVVEYLERIMSNDMNDEFDYEELIDDIYIYIENVEYYGNHCHIRGC